MHVCVIYVFFFKQKTAYEMRISDWSSDVCSSDLPGLLGLEPGDLRADHAAHLAGADADGALVLGVDDGVGLDELGDAPGEQQRVEFGVARRTLARHLQLVARDLAVVAVLHQQAGADALDVDGVAAIAVDRKSPR